MTDHGADRRSGSVPVPEHTDAMAEFDLISAEEGRHQRRTAGKWIAACVVGLAIAALGVLQADTRGELGGQTACARGDQKACRASAARLGAACRPDSISRADDPAAARAQCERLAHALEPLQRGMDRP